MNLYVRRAAIGAAAGLVASISLVAVSTVTMPSNLPMAIALAVALGALYGLVLLPTPFAFAESTFTATALAVLVWSLLSVILLPALAGEAPQWNTNGMQAAFPQFAGWILYGAVLGFMTKALNDGVDRLMGAEVAPSKPAAPEAKRIVILGGGFAGMTTA